MLSKQQISHIKSLKLKKYRQNYNEFIIEGEKMITEALLADVEVKQIIATKEWLEQNNVLNKPAIEVIEATDKQIMQIVSTSSPQPVLGVLKFKKTIQIQYKNLESFCLVLDAISDPGNLGTIIRSADWFGIKQILCSENCVDLYNYKVLAASMGSIFRVNLVYCNLPEILPQIKLKKYAATMHGKNIFTNKMEAKSVLVIGNESHGISKEIISLCDEEITIPRIGKAESLNAGVACSILLSTCYS